MEGIDSPSKERYNEPMTDLKKLALFSDDDLIVNMPFPLYCAKCDTIMPKGLVARCFDAATYYHLRCPNEVPTKQESTSIRGFNEYRDSKGNLYVNRDVAHSEWGVRGRD